jgi:hypothetical protein
LAIPFTITVYTFLHDKRQSDIARDNHQHVVDLANRTRLNDLYIANEQLLDGVLDSYLDFLADHRQTISTSSSFCQRYFI